MLGSESPPVYTAPPSFDPAAGLETAVDNALVVGVLKRVYQLVDERQRGFGGARSSGLNALHEFRHDVALFDAIDSGEVGMVEAR
jgi:hypothetical protein